jgi:hypothetical protein
MTMTPSPSTSYHLPLLAVLVLLCFSSSFASPSSSYTSDDQSLSFYRHLLRSKPHSPLPPSPRSSPNANNASIVDVYSFGAVGDGVTDNTDAFQRAISSVSSSGGGTVLIPRGYFLFKGVLVVPQGVTLEGTYSAVPSHPMAGMTEVPTITGSLLLPTAGMGSETGPSFLTLQRDATLKGVVIHYPSQKMTQPPVPFPWTVDLTSDNAAVLDVECLNCWNFIRAVGSGRHYLARIQGQPINIGVFVDETYDIGRIENVHFNPWFSVHPDYLRWQLTQGRAFVFARSDWEYVLNTFAFGYAIGQSSSRTPAPRLTPCVLHALTSLLLVPCPYPGYHFIASKAGAMNGNLIGIGADMAVNASVQVDAADSFGLLITNGEFTAFIDPTFGNITADSTEVVVSASNTGAVRFVNTAFWGPSQRIARIEGTGTVGFGDCTFCQWDADKKGNAAIQVNGGGSVSVRGCEFQQDGVQVEMGEGVRRAVIVGNLITGKERIVGKAKSMQVGLNAADE